MPRRVAAAALVYWTMAPASLGVVLAQTAAAKLPRVGVLYLSEPFPDPGRRRGFALGMREHGYVDGRNVVLVWRDAQGRADRLDVLADELVRTNVDVIVAGGPGPLAAARRAAPNMPIVAVSGSDPVAEGWAESLARPGGNVTGLSATFPGIGPKRLALAKEALPALARVAVVIAPDELPRHGADEVDLMAAAATTLGVRMHVVEVRKAEDFAVAVRSALDAKSQALVAIETSLVVVHRGRLCELAARERVPVIGGFPGVGGRGVLIAYGPDLEDLLRRAAGHVARILKGARASELPIERPTKLDLSIDLQVARELGVTLPRSLLLRADRIAA